MSRDARLTIFLLALVVGLSVLAAVREARQASLTPLLSSSAEASGAKALALWLDELGYDVSTRTLGAFQLDAATDVVLMLAPSTQVTPAELEELDAWIDDGGTLVLAVDRFSYAPLLEHFEFEQEAIYFNETVLTPTGPLLRDVVAWDSAELAPDFILHSETRDYATLLAMNDKAVVATFTQGDGRVVLTTLDDAFSNLGVQRNGNAELVLNLITLGASAETGTIWFNDWHHGIRGFATDAIIGPSAWLRRSYPGRALLYASLVAVVMLLWHGRRFGREVPLPEANVARSPLEYITAMANLNRRANTRSVVQADYLHRLKRKLGARYHLDPAMPNADFLHALQQANPNLNHTAIANLVGQLSNPSLDEATLVTLVRETATILDH